MSKKSTVTWLSLYSWRKGHWRRKTSGRRLETSAPPVEVANRHRHTSSTIPRTRRAKDKSPDVEQVCLLASRNYQVAATVGVSTVVTTPVRAILDTGAGPNLVREDILPEDWERHRLPDAPSYHVVGAGGALLPQRGVVTLHVQLGQLRAQAKLIVVKSLMAGCILGCQFIYRHVQSILPKERRALLTGGSSIAILQFHEEPVLDKGAKREQPTEPSNKVRLSKLVTIPARTEGLIQVQCYAPSLRFLKASLRGNSLGVYMANGVAEILPNRPFSVRVVNTSTRDRKLPKGMILGHALPHPLGIVALAEL